MKQVFLHIGQHKTGSTALQRFLLANRGRLIETRVLYPQTGRVNIQGAPCERHMLLSLQPLSDPEMIPRLEREIAASPADTAVISGEGFCRASARPQLRKGIKHLAAGLAGHDCRVLVYLRPQEELAQSLYNWRIKEGMETRPFDRYIDEHLDENAEYFHYDALLEPFEEIFGPERIMVRIYDRPSFPGGSIYRDFLQAVGAPWSDDFSLPQHGLNHAAPPRVLEVMRCINGMAPQRLESSAQLTKLSTRLLEGEDAATNAKPRVSQIGYSLDSFRALPQRNLNSLRKRNASLLVSRSTIRLRVRDTNPRRRVAADAA